MNRPSLRYQERAPATVRALTTPARQVGASSSGGTRPRSGALFRRGQSLCLHASAHGGRAEFAAVAVRKALRQSRGQRRGAPSHRRAVRRWCALATPPNAPLTRALNGVALPPLSALRQAAASCSIPPHHRRFPAGPPPRACSHRRPASILASHRFIVRHGPRRSLAAGDRYPRHALRPRDGLFEYPTAVNVSCDPYPPVPLMGVSPPGDHQHHRARPHTRRAHRAFGPGA